VAHSFARWARGKREKNREKRKKRKESRVVFGQKALRSFLFELRAKRREKKGEREKKEEEGCPLLFYLGWGRSEGPSCATRREKDEGKKRERGGKKKAFTSSRGLFRWIMSTSLRKTRIATTEKKEPKKGKEKRKRRKRKRKAT